VLLGAILLAFCAGVFFCRLWLRERRSLDVAELVN